MKCSNCGAELAENQVFCSECGTKVEGAELDEKVIQDSPITEKCTNCGTKLPNGQKFCPNCGQKVGLSADNSFESAIEQFNSDANNANAKKKKAPVIIGIVVAIISVVAIAGVKLLPNILVSTEELCTQGQYEKAYEKASGEEKNNVLAQNVVAYLSNETSNGLKDPSSFVLRSAYYYVYYDPDEEQVSQYAVLYVNGTNSFGASVGSYYVWAHDPHIDNGWEFCGNCSSLSLDKDDDDYLTSYLAKFVVNNVDDTIELSNSEVKSINNMFEEGTLDNVELLDMDSLDTSVMPVLADAD